MTERTRWNLPVVDLNFLDKIPTRWWQWQLPQRFGVASAWLQKQLGAFNLWQELVEGQTFAHSSPPSLRKPYRIKTLRRHQTMPINRGGETPFQCLYTLTVVLSGSFTNTVWAFLVKRTSSVSHLLTTAKLSKWSIHFCQFPQSPLKVSRISSGLEDIVQLCRLRQCNATKFNSTAEFSTATKTTQYRLVNIQKYFSTTAHLEMRSYYVIIT